MKQNSSSYIEQNPKEAERFGLVHETKTQLPEKNAELIMISNPVNRPANKNKSDF